MARLEAELGQQRPQKKGESLEMFFASNKLQRKRGERITDYITRFEEGIKTLQDNDINLQAIDDVPGWMLMRKASLTQERRERLIAALPDERFAINDVTRVLVRLFPELHINEHRESDGYSRRSRNDPLQRIRDENKRRTRVAAAVLSRLVTSGQTQIVLMTKPMLILQISKVLCEVNWRRCHLEWTIFPALSRVFSLKMSLQGWRMRQWICPLSWKRW